MTYSLRVWIRVSGGEFEFDVFRTGRSVCRRLGGLKRRGIQCDDWQLEAGWRSARAPSMTRQRTELA